MDFDENFDMYLFFYPPGAIHPSQAPQRSMMMQGAPPPPPGGVQDLRRDPGQDPRAGLMYSRPRDPRDPRDPRELDPRDPRAMQQQQREYEVQVILHVT